MIESHVIQQTLRILRDLEATERTLDRKVVCNLDGHRMWSDELRDGHWDRPSHDESLAIFLVHENWMDLKGRFVTELRYRD
jgi:hypothetical protein